jgi:phosphomevalonate kinase
MTATEDKTAEATVVSAPGKVLLAGGYLVLENAYPGTVVSTSSRFYSAIIPSDKPYNVFVRSPQFINAEWEYSVHIDDEKVKVEAE